MNLTIETLLPVLSTIDNAGLSLRDVKILHAVRVNPGVMGQELAKKLGYETRSVIQTRLRILFGFNYMEDRRKTDKHRSSHPNRLYITEKGIAFLDSLIPNFDL